MYVPGVVSQTATMLYGCLQFQWIHQHFMPYVWQLVFAYISIQGWVIGSDEDGVFDGSCQILDFSAHNTAEHTPISWNRYVNDTFVVLETSYKD